DNNHVEKILFVGLLPLGQSSFLSGLNNVVPYPMHNLPSSSGRAFFSDSFGLTEMEVASLLEQKKIIDKLDILKRYYNGYQTSTGVRIFNPHSVISYLYNNVINYYWINSSHTTTLVKYLKMCGPDIKELLYNLLYSFYQSQGVDLLQDVELKSHLRYDIIDKNPDINAIYTLLYYSGYLTVVSSTDITMVKLVIPNEEVAYQWKLWIFDIIGMERVKTNGIYESLFKKNIVAFCEQFPSFYMELVSCYDIADAKRCRLYETWYHSFILGALA
ncbi:9495_t:CDS:1, partial [Funneliformis geosporum]